MAFGGCVDETTVQDPDGSFVLLLITWAVFPDATTLFTIHLPIWYTAPMASTDVLIPVVFCVQVVPLVEYATVPSSPDATHLFEFVLIAE